VIKNKRIKLSAAITSAIVLSLSVQAREIEEVIVTSEFRANNVQDTPLAITAVTGEMLEARNQSNVYEVAMQAPNVELKPQRANFGPAIQSSIRGIGQTDFNPAKEPGVGMYVDDVYYSTMTGTLFDLLDLDRVEILRGPQGTLSGRNSIGGAIKLFSRKPGDAPSFIEATVGSDNRLDLKFALDFEFSDSFAGRLSGVSRNQDGYVDIRDFESGSKIGDLGGKDTQGLRGNFIWKPSDTVEVNVIVDATRDNSGRSPEVLDPRTINPSLQAYIDPNRDVVYGSLFESSSPVPYAISPDISLESEGFSGKVTWDINDNLQLTSITAYRQYDSSWDQDQDMSPQRINVQRYSQENEQFSQEIRVNGAVGDLLDFTAGVFYMDVDVSTTTFIDIFIPGPNFFLFQDADDGVEASSQAVFLHGVWHLSDRLNLTTGLRYTKDEKDQTLFKFNPVTGVANPGFPFSDSYTSNELDYRVSLDFRVGEDVLLYAQTATGYKGGGMNPRANNINQLIAFDTETLVSYELGVKSTLLDGRMRLNAALFHMDYDDIQIQFQAGPGVCPEDNDDFSCLPIRNAGEADIDGLELEMQYYVTDNFSIDASASYIDFEFSKVSDLAPINEGEVNPLTPETKYSLGLQYDLPLASGASISSRVDLSYQDETMSAIPSSEFSLIDAYTVANARFAWKSTDEDWTVTASVLNLADKEYDLSNNNLLAFGQLIGVTPARGREYTVGVRRNF
jgi:iron complex outermembrane receptor protein